MEGGFLLESLVIVYIVLRKIGGCIFLVSCLGDLSMKSHHLYGQVPGRECTSSLSARV